VAGLIKARDRAAFDRANVEGSRQVAQAAKAAGRDSSWSPAWPRASRICPTTPAASVAEKTQLARFLAVI
jgi:alkanesulfonate monooxygenase SsuD/methylene tetrahydromethanopterin reductase-like flavin-dependent oxidoreductase (luciferase family)